MQRRWPGLMLCMLLGVVVGCPTLTVERNAFLGYTEEYGVAGQQRQVETGPAGAGAGAEETFRRSLTLTFVNAHPTAILKTSFAAWVEVSSIRSAEQQDALLRQGYMQVTQQDGIRIGTAFVLPPGTFIYNGPGTAGATPVTLLPAQGAAGQEQGQGGGTTQVTPTTAVFELITPDKILVFLQPPVSCDSVAFTYTDPIVGEVLSGASTAGGGYKTLAQVDVYQCSPLRPGLFFSAVGGARPANEYREGDPVTFTFLPSAIAGGAFATVTIGTPDTEAASGP